MPMTNKPDDSLPKQRQKADLAGAAEQLPKGRHGGLDAEIKPMKHGVRNDACLDTDPEERGLEGSGPMPGDEEAGRD